MFIRSDWKKEDEKNASPTRLNQLQVYEVGSLNEMEHDLQMAARAYADSELGLENLALFNEEMSSISMNAF